MPYPQTGKASDTEKGSNKVKVSKSGVETKGSAYKSGGAPAKDGSKIVNKGKTAFTFQAVDVKFEGKDCARFLELPSSPYGWKTITPPFPLLQTADGRTQVECAGQLHDTTVIPAPAPQVTYVDPPPFEGFVVPYRSGRIPTREEVEAYRANPEAADARIEADIDRAAAIYEQEWQGVLARTAGVRAAVDAKIDAYTTLNPEYDNFPVRRVVKQIREDGFYENEILVYYGPSVIDMWVQRFDA